MRTLDVVAVLVVVVVRQAAADRRAREREEHVRDPVDADHVGLDADREHRHPRRAQPGRPAPEREQDGSHPGEEDGEAGDADLDPELGVRRLTRLEVDARSRGADPRVAEPEAERVMDHRPDAVAEVAQVARCRGIARR